MDASDVETDEGSLSTDSATETDSDTPTEKKGNESNSQADEPPEPTPQSAALRRQQRYVGVGGALVAGGALAVIAFQRFTDNPLLAAVAGVAGTALVLWLVRKSIFPGDSMAD